MAEVTRVIAERDNWHRGGWLTTARARAQAASARRGNFQFGRTK
jgi:hypothetical protein